MVFSSMQKQGEYKREQAGKETYGHDVNPSVMRKDLEPETISIDGQKCIKIDEWKSGEDSYLLCNSTEDSDFFYAEVNGNTHFEYDHKPDREEIEDDFIDIEAMRDIDRHEAEVFSRFEGSDDFLILTPMQSVKSWRMEKLTKKRMPCLLLRSRLQRKTRLSHTRDFP